MQKTKTILIPSLTSGIFIGILFSFLISISRFVDGHPTELLLKNDKTTESLELEDADNKNDETYYRREEILENLQKVFGIRVQSENKTVRHTTPPQFMTELYNAIADPSGVTRGKNPYNAKIVRCFVERDNWLPQLYLFNISGLELNESVIEAELHLYRRQSALKIIHPTILRSPYYLIRVYQVLERQSMDEPDLHRLLNVHYVGAHASGWQVFNVKQAVLAWLAGAPNLGLIVTASTLFGDEATIEFTRRNDYHHSKQPILVLFNDDGRTNEESSDNIHRVPRYYAYNDDDDEKDEELVEDDTNDDRSFVEEDEENNESEAFNDYHSGSTFDRRKRQQDDSTVEELKKTAGIYDKKDINKEFVYGTQLGKNLKNGEIELFQRFKKNLKELKKKNDHLSGRFVRQIRSANLEHKMYQSDDAPKFVSGKKTKVQQILSSMEIYERALLRQQIVKDSKKILREKNKRKIEEANYKKMKLKRFPRETREENEKYFTSSEDDVMECTRHELYVDFNGIGLSNSIIAPKGYSAFQCLGRCHSLLTPDHESTNHANLQAIIHRLGLVKNVKMPCCVPTKLHSNSILFYDDHENVVLKVYEDMIVDRCGCR